MNTVYCCRADLDKERFLFDQIAERLKRNREDHSGGSLGGSRCVFLIVPEQYTLQAERNAFEHLGVTVLMDLEVLSQSRLRSRVLAETGGTNRTPIDQSGRQMLLTRILLEQEQRLVAFRGMHQRQRFVQLINDLISELKQYDTTPEDLAGILAETEEGTILHRKLSDLVILYEEYEKALAGRYLDAEDFQQLFLDQIRHSKQIRNATIWVDGFDYFTPRNQRVLLELLRYAAEVNILLTALPPGNAADRDRELFELPRRFLMQFSERAAERGVGLDIQEVPQQYRKSDLPAEFSHLERELFSYPYQKFFPQKETEPGYAAGENSLRLCLASNYYTEAETIAARIIGLVREEGYRYRDMVVIINDLDLRGTILKRTLADYGIPCFMDQKRSIVHHPGVELILSVLSICNHNWQFEDVFRFLKTGMTPLVNADDLADLENYAYQYRLKSWQWKRGFTYIKKDRSTDHDKKLEQLNSLRERLVEAISPLETEWPKAATAREKTQLLYRYLTETLEFETRAEDLANQLVEAGSLEYAEETSQVWATVLALLDQITELLGDAPLSGEDYAAILQTGFEGVEIGLIPTSIDEVLIGTMQRTRTGRVRALFVAGANDGVLPSNSNAEGLLNEDEKSLILNRHREICKQDLYRTQEEQLAIYRNLCHAQERLWLSYSASDQEGGELKPSMILDKIRRLFPQIPLEKDLINEGGFLELVETSVSATRHLTEALRRNLDGETLGTDWKVLYNWLHTQPAGWQDHLRRMERALLYTNQVEQLEQKLVEQLYLRNGALQHSVSPSRLERFGRCPFAHFILYGIRPEERRIFDIAGRELGDLYHECLMHLSNELTSKDLELSDPASPWMLMTEESCRARIGELVSEMAARYQERTTTDEEMAYRIGRMTDVCFQSAWAMVQHVQQGRIKRAWFEAEFGRGQEAQFPPVEIKVDRGTVLIEGKIDRVDVLGNPESSGAEFVKIIDYKSGSDKFSAEEAMDGWKLQLMIYLKAAVQGLQKEAAENKTEAAAVKPAGVFYFGISEPMIDSGELSAEERAGRVADQIKRSFRLDGVLLQENLVIESLDSGISGYSDVVPIRLTKDGYAGTSARRLLSEEDFQQFIGAVDQTIETLCKEFLAGSIEIKPKKRKNETACTYCDYKSICNYEN